MRYLVLHGATLPEEIFLILENDPSFAQPFTFIREKLILLSSPVYSSDLANAERFIQIVKHSSVIILVDLLTESASIYKGTNPQEARNLFLPKFLQLYKQQTNKQEPCILTIKDFSKDPIKKAMLGYSLCVN